MRGCVRAYVKRRRFKEHPSTFAVRQPLPFSALKGEPLRLIPIFAVKPEPYRPPPAI